MISLVTIFWLKVILNNIYFEVFKYSIFKNKLETGKFLVKYKINTNLFHIKEMFSGIHTFKNLMINCWIRINFYLFSRMDTTTK